MRMKDCGMMARAARLRIAARSASSAYSLSDWAGAALHSTVSGGTCWASSRVASL
jgi:hypothetical protein